VAGIRPSIGARARLALLIALALAGTQGTLLVWEALDKSDTYDEPVYLTASALLVRYHNFQFDAAAPVLPKWAFGLAVLAAGPDLSQLSREAPIANAQLNWEQPPHVLLRMLRAARGCTIAVTVAGGLLLWGIALRLGRKAALLAHVCWCFSPTVLAHGALATLDAWCGVAMIAVLWAMFRLLDRPHLYGAALCAGTCALAACCKQTGAAVAPFVAVVVVYALPRARVRALGLFTLTFLLAVWACYAFHRTALFRLDGMPAPDSPRIPLGDYIFGFRRQLYLGYVEGHTTYLAGARAKGFVTFFLACLAFKLSPAAQLLAAARLVCARMRWREHLLLVYPAALLIALSVARTQLGIRYLLPAFPWAILWMASVVNQVRRFAPLAPAACLAVAGAGAVFVLALHPDQLMYANVWAGGPDGGSRWLASDWGQDKLRLARWIGEHQIRDLRYLRYGSIDGAWGIHAEPVACQPTAGTYALHAAPFYRGAPSPGCLDWLRNEPPDERIGHSIYIYRVDTARAQRLAARTARDQLAGRNSPG
jgi:hypothetical protein